MLESVQYWAYDWEIAAIVIISVYYNINDAIGLSITILYHYYNYFNYFNMKMYDLWKGLSLIFLCHTIELVPIDIHIISYFKSIMWELYYFINIFYFCMSSVVQGWLGSRLLSQLKYSKYYRYSTLYTKYKY